MLMHSKHRAFFRTAISALLALPLLAPSVEADGKLAVKAGRIITQAGDEIENGVIVIQGGRIAAIGAEGEVQIPWDAPVIDGSELVAFPGFVEAHSSRGMDRPNENVEVAPYLSIEDSIDPVNFYFQDSLRWGVTTINVQHGHNCAIGARGMVVKPIGMTVEEMMVVSRVGLKMSTLKSGRSRATQTQLLRDTFGDLRLYLEDLVQQKKDGRDTARREALYQGRDLEGENAKGRPMGGSAWKVAELELVPRGEVDEQKEPLLHLVEGKLDAYFWCGAPMDVAAAIEIARDNGFLARTKLVVSNSCWKAADQIQAAGVPVILTGSLTHIERDAITGEETETFVPGVFQEKGIPYCLSSGNSTTQSLWYQAALAVGLGLERQQALAAATTAPAGILGLTDRVGSLEAGKDGNVVLFSGDPLSSSSLVQHVIIEGQHVYDRSKDVRVKHLQSGERPPGTQATGAEPPPEHDHGEGEEEHGEGDDEKDEDKEN